MVNAASCCRRSQQQRQRFNGQCPHLFLGEEWLLQIEESLLQLVQKDEALLQPLDEAREALDNLLQNAGERDDRAYDRHPALVQRDRPAQGCGQQLHGLAAGVGLSAGQAEIRAADPRTAAALGTQPQQRGATQTGAARAGVRIFVVSGNGHLSAEQFNRHEKRLCQPATNSAFARRPASCWNSSGVQSSPAQAAVFAQVAR